MDFSGGLDEALVESSSEETSAGLIYEVAPAGMVGFGAMSIALLTSMCIVGFISWLRQ